MTTETPAASAGGGFQQKLGLFDERWKLPADIRSGKPSAPNTAQANTLKEATR